MKVYLLTIIVFIISFSILAEDNSQYNTEPMNKATSAIAVNIANLYPNYPATPGDVYDIFFLTAANKSMNIRGFVDANYFIDLSFIGKVYVKDLNYPEVQKLLKDKILIAYPNSIINVVIKVLGKFRVKLVGEVLQSEIVEATSITTLKEVILDKTTDYASFRNIKIESEDGKIKEYDLFLFKSDADIKYNPYLKSNDIITISTYQREVSISGKIKRPGNYQLLKNDTLYDLIHTYGNGFDKLAETSVIEIQRRIENSETYSESTIYVDAKKDDMKLIKLHDLDVITIPNKVTYSGIIIIQGAVSSLPTDDSPETGDISIGTSISNKIIVPIVKGNRISTVIRNMEGTFNLVSDLENAVILRGNKKITINLNNILSMVDNENDIVIQDKDILIIPFKQLQVFIGGSVNNPGTVPFIENRTAKYYIGLSGNFNRKENLFKGYSIRNIEGKKVSKNAIIQPEDTIWVYRDHPMSYIEEYGGWITTIITTIVISYQLTNLSSTLNN